MFYGATTTHAGLCSFVFLLSLLSIASCGKQAEAAASGHQVSHSSPGGPSVDLWPLFQSSHKCLDGSGKVVQNQTQCQIWAELHGHVFYQYNSAKKICLTTNMCDEQVPSLMWKIYHVKIGVDETHDDNHDENDDDNDEEGDEFEPEEGELTPSEQPPSRVAVQLRKQYVPVYRDGAVVAHKTAYFGDIEVGMGSTPQRFSVVFDTGSGHMLLPSLQCRSEACMVHRRYDGFSSASVVPIDHDGAPVTPHAFERDQIAIEFGTGEVVGEFAYETVCLAQANESSDGSPPTDGPIRDYPRNLEQHPRAFGRGCVRLRVVLATEMTKDPFYNFQFDGVLGLGLEGMALDPEFSFFGQLTRQLLAPSPLFGVYISRDDSTSSELSFGGVDKQRFDTTMQWTPVLSPHLGYWQVAIKSVRVGDKVLDLCRDEDCVGILDTGTSLLGAPEAAAQVLHPQLARIVPDDPPELDCRDFPGPDLVFDLGGFEVTLTAAEYSRPTAMRVTGGQKTRVVCRASLLRTEIGPPLGPKAFILGEPVLRRYYTAYNWKSRQVGFALAKHPPKPPSTADQAATLIVE